MSQLCTYASAVFLVCTSLMCQSEYQSDKIQNEFPKNEDVRWTNTDLVILSKLLPHSEGIIDDPCRTFIEGSVERKEFYSPGWPNPYPNHTDCVLVLEAPRGYLIRLDFRDCFDLEPSDDCRFDFLEVRDGAHGYCDLLGQFCGKEFPPMITSTDRYLWMRFHSDENIEYSGFKAVYDFIPKPDSVSTPEISSCRIEVSGDEGTFSSTDIPSERIKLVEKYQIAIDCMWIITVKEGWKIQLSFPEFKLEKPNDCDSNFVDVFSDRTDLPSRQKNFCGSVADSVISKNNVMYIRFFSEPRAMKSYFRSTYTAFREKKGTEVCAEDEWDCEDATCISIRLRCNGNVNCRFRWDEDDCVTAKTVTLNSEHIIIIMIVFSFILSGMCLTFVFHCFKKLIRDYHTIQEHLRQSYEQQLNMLENKSDVSITVGGGKKQFSRTNSTQSNEYNGVREIDPCYVPGNELLPILVQNHVGNNATSNEYEQQPEMCDMASQTKEYLFNNQNQSINTSVQFTTFGYDKIERYSPVDEMVEMECPERYSCNSIAYSIEATKPTPDVIQTH